MPETFRGRRYIGACTELNAFGNGLSGIEPAVVDAGEHAACVTNEGLGKQRGIGDQGREGGSGDTQL